jgi:hypothetical protein
LQVILSVLGFFKNVGIAKITNATAFGSTMTGGLANTVNTELVGLLKAARRA